MPYQNLERKKTSNYLSNFILRYRSDTDTADFIAPPFKVQKSSDKYLVYGIRTNRIYDNKLMRRSPILEIDLEATESTYLCEEFALGAFVADRDLVDTDTVVRIKEEKLQHTKDRQIAAREYRVYQIAASTALVPNAAATTIWSNVAAVPITDIRTACIAINNATGKNPNRIVMTYQAAMHMINTTEWKGMFQYTDTGFGRGLWSAIDGLRNLGLEPRITNSRGVSSYEGCSSDPDWDTMLGNKVLVFYAEPTPTRNSMTFMSSPFCWKDKVMQWYSNRERGIKYEIMEYIDELLVAAGAGYLITGVY